MKHFIHLLHWREPIIDINLFLFLFTIFSLILILSFPKERNYDLICNSRIIAMILATFPFYDLQLNYKIIF